MNDRGPCTLINPLCPNDLCTMGWGHEGVLSGVHRLETMAEPAALPHFPMAPQGTSVERLIEMGAEIADDPEHGFWMGAGTAPSNAQGERSDRLAADGDGSPWGPLFSDGSTR